MRALWMVAPLLLSACSAIYPANDFHQAQCGPDFQHWSRPKPCTRADLACLDACGDNAACQQRCYALNRQCESCIVTEFLLCARESGCEIEYENLTCCAEGEACELTDSACLETGCEGEFQDFLACETEVAADCVGVAVGVCG